jgi:hypothetical protein
LAATTGHRVALKDHKWFLPGRIVSTPEILRREHKWISFQPCTMERDNPGNDRARKFIALQFAPHNEIYQRPGSITKRLIGEGVGVRMSVVLISKFGVDKFPLFDTSIYQAVPLVPNVMPQGSL